MTAKECADEQEQGQSRVEMSEGDGEPEGQRGGKGDDQMACVTTRVTTRVTTKVAMSERDGQRA